MSALLSSSVMQLSTKRTRYGSHRGTDVKFGQSAKVSIWVYQSKNISNDQELIQSDPTSCPQHQKGNN